MRDVALATGRVGGCPDRYSWRQWSCRSSDEISTQVFVEWTDVDVFVEAGAGGLDAPGGMVFDPEGVLHVASVNGNTVLRFDPSGAPLPILVDAAAAGIDAPTHITLAPALGG